MQPVHAAASSYAAFNDDSWKRDNTAWRVKVLTFLAKLDPTALTIISKAVPGCTASSNDIHTQFCSRGLLQHNQSLGVLAYLVAECAGKGLMLQEHFPGVEIPTPSTPAPERLNKFLQEMYLARALVQSGLDLDEVGELFDSYQSSSLTPMQKAVEIVSDISASVGLDKAISTLKAAFPDISFEKPAPGAITGAMPALPTSALFPPSTHTASAAALAAPGSEGATGY